MTNSEFEKLISREKDKLFRFALYILGNNEDSKDAVQEVVLKLWKNRQALQKEKNIESYCLNALKNHCFDLLRKKKHKMEYQGLVKNDYVEENNFDKLDMVEQLKRETLKLPKNQRLAVELKDFQDLDYEEISEITNQSINTIRANVSRGRRKLFEIFKEEMINA